MIMFYFKTSVSLLRAQISGILLLNHFNFLIVSLSGNSCSMACQSM